MKILIFGGCGFLGTNIALEAIRRGHTVTAFDSLTRSGSERNIRVLEKAGVEIIRGDIRDREDFRSIQDVPDVIMHLAAQVGIFLSLAEPELDFNVNALGTINVLEFARTMGNIPVIYASTNKVFAGVNQLPIIESATRYDFVDVKGIPEFFPMLGGQHTPYGLSKLVGALYCKEYFYTYKLPTVVNHMSCLYGYFQSGRLDQGWIDFILKCILKDGSVTVFGDGKQVRDLLWCEDVANLYVTQAEQIDKIAGQEFSIGGGKEYTLSVLEAIKYCIELTGKQADIVFKPWREADQRVYYADATKAELLLNWKPTVDPKEGIKRMYEQYK